MGLLDRLRRRRSPARRLAAVARLLDPAKLADAAKNDPDERVRLAAVGRLTDQERLAEVAAEADSLDVRLAAIRRITNQELLAELVRRRKNYDCMIACLERITDPKIIAAIAKDERCNITARRIAIDMFAGQSMLIEVARAVRTPEVREAALAKLRGVSQELAGAAESPAGAEAAAAPADPERAVAAILASYDPAEVVETLGRLRGSRGAIRALAAIARGDSASSGPAQRARELLIKSLRHPRPAIRREAAAALDGLLEADQRQALKPLLEDAHGEEDPDRGR